MFAVRFHRAPGVPVLALALALSCLGASSGLASLTFVGSRGAASTGRVVVGWSNAGVPDSLVDTFHMVPDSVYAGVTLHSSAITGPPVPVYLAAQSGLSLAAPGPADSTAPVAYGSLNVIESGDISAPARRTQATLDLALRYTSDQPMVYWAVVLTPDFAPNPAPGPPGDYYLTHSAADSNAWAWWGSAPNTGELPGIGAVLEKIVTGEGVPGYWYYAWSFRVFIDDHDFRHPVLGAGTGLPVRLGFSAPRPNPARAATAFDFALPAPARARLEIFDTAGRRVRSLVDAVLPAGTHGARWDGRDERGAAAGAGVYFARLTVGRDVLVRRLVLLP